MTTLLVGGKGEEGGLWGTKSVCERNEGRGRGGGVRDTSKRQEAGAG